MRKKTGVMAVIALLVLASLAGCARKESWEAYSERRMKEDPVFFTQFLQEEAVRKSQQIEVRYVSMSCFNHGSYRAGSFSVEEVAYGQISQDMVGGAFGCGGLLALGYPVPVKWRPGLKVKVRWNTYAPGATEPTWHEKYTTILPYAQVGSLYAHFFPGDQVRVVVSTPGVGNSLHPIAEEALEPPPEME